MKTLLLTTCAVGCLYLAVVLHWETEKAQESMAKHVAELLELKEDVKQHLCDSYTVKHSLFVGDVVSTKDIRDWAKAAKVQCDCDKRAEGR